MNKKEGGKRDKKFLPISHDTSKKQGKEVEKFFGREKISWKAEGKSRLTEGKENTGSKAGMAVNNVSFVGIVLFYFSSYFELFCFKYFSMN